MTAIVAQRVGAERRWVVDGNYLWLAETTWPAADVIVFLDLDRVTILRRVIIRSLYRAIFRRRLWNGNRQAWSTLCSTNPRKSIIALAWQRQPHYRTHYRTMLTGVYGAKMVHLTSPRAVRAFLRAVSDRSDGSAGGQA